MRTRCAQRTTGPAQALALVAAGPGRPLVAAAALHTAELPIQAVMDTRPSGSRTEPVLQPVVDIVAVPGMRMLAERRDTLIVVRSPCVLVVLSSYTQHTTLPLRGSFLPRDIVSRLSVWLSCW